MAAPDSEQSLVFDYLALRLVIGLFAFSLPVVVGIASSFAPIPSISASYHTGGRDFLVGWLFVIGILLIAYKGHAEYPSEQWVSSLGGVAAFIAALCPAACANCPDTALSVIHFIAGAIVFFAIAYFCFGPFRRAAEAKPGAKAKRRAMVYILCGSVIVASMLAMGIASRLPDPFKNQTRIIFYGETIALLAFGFAWLVACRLLGWFADEDERLKLGLNRRAPG
jgi:hypothetical protein